MNRKTSKQTKTTPLVLTFFFNKKKSLGVDGLFCATSSQEFLALILLIKSRGMRWW